MRGALPWLHQLRHDGGRLRRALLATAVGLVVLGVVGMHQLSAGHDLVTPSVGAHHHASAHEHFGGQSSLEDHLAWPDPPSRAGSSLRYVQAVSSARVGEIATRMELHASTSGSPGDDCPGCGHHSLGLGACLLALTLLVLCWGLPRRRARHLSRWMMWRPATVSNLLGRWVPALSLAELSLLRA